MAAALASPRPVTLAAIAGAHGIGGEVRLKLFAQDLDSLKRQRTVQIDGAPFFLTSVREGGTGAVARLDGVNSRDAAEALRGKLLTVPRSALPPLEPGEYYHADIIGLPCASADGDPLGHVVGVENFGAGDLLEIERMEGGKSLVPFRAPIAELRGDRIVVDPLFLA